MKSGLKKNIDISINCLILSVIINLIAWLAIYFHPSIGNEIKWYESMLMNLFYSIIIFSFIAVFGSSKVEWLAPVSYLGLSLLVIFKDELEGFDLLFILNFGFSQLCYFIYSILRRFDLLANQLLDKIVFNALFFVYQFFLLYWSKHNSVSARFLRSGVSRFGDSA